MKLQRRPKKPKRMRLTPRQLRKASAGELRLKAAIAFFENSTR